MEANTIWDEMKAARAYGFDAYWKASREWRALMVAEMTVTNALEALTRYDSVEHKDKG